MPFPAGTKLGPYEIVAPLGAGGMGEVYRARDTKLARDVALKVLPANLATDADRMARFGREAQVLASLNHPNIASIYGLEDSSGVRALVMELVEGSTLADRIAQGAIPVEEALAIAKQMAEALEYAHERRIIHRDLKPANIMITKGGRAKLLDFGLAKIAEPVTALGNETLNLSAAAGTVVGTFMGTPAYVSPEQAEGRRLDARSDIFSFGLVLYEMLCGQRAFHGETTVAILAAILHQEPRQLREIKPGIPISIQECVVRCLRKDPTQRFQTMQEVMPALAEPRSSEMELKPPPAKENAQSIAVLPFVNMSGDKENEYFSDGLAEEIINALTKIPELKVIARTSAFAFRGAERNLKTIGERLKVGTVLEGSVRKAGNRIRVTAQLIQIADETHLWSERYDREMTDIFAIQDDISLAIAGALEVKFASPQRRTGNVEAFQNYLKGLYWYQRYTQESLTKAKEAFEQALALDPSYAPAYAGLAVFYFGLGALSIKPMIEMAPLAKSAAEKALAIDQSLSEAHSVMGLITGAVEYDWKTAQRHFRAAMAIEPVPALVSLRYGLYYLTPLRQFDEAVEQYERALETDPLSMMVHFGLAFAFYCQRRYDLAIEHAAKAVEIYPDYWLVHFVMGIALSEMGALLEAIASLEKTVQLSPTFAMAAGFLAVAYARAGMKERAEKLMEGVREKSSKQFVSPTCFAIYYAALGETEKTFEFLNAAFAQRDPYLTRMDANPYFEPYHSDPRYRELLRKLNLS
ncbi:MAG: protein kinase [Candidatus Acidiferrales bacterium]